jgi:hypothetical protein
MPASDLDITRTAHLRIQQHGAAATTKAREMMEKTRLRVTPRALMHGDALSLPSARRTRRRLTPVTDAPHESKPAGHDRRSDGPAMTAWPSIADDSRHAMLRAVESVEEITTNACTVEADHPRGRARRDEGGQRRSPCFVGMRGQPAAAQGSQRAAGRHRERDDDGTTPTRLQAVTIFHANRRRLSSRSYSALP